MYGAVTCPSGGWLLKPATAGLPTYWLPQLPALRKHDVHGRIVAEESAPLRAFDQSALESAIEIEVDNGLYLEVALWRLPSEAVEIVDALEKPMVLERQPIFLLASHTSYRGPASVYLYLLDGRIYEDRFDLKAERKICCELEAYALYLALDGLATATRKRLYRLLMCQIAFSVISRQALDGGWVHGEWTDFMESHYRFHNAAILMLTAVFEERGDETTRAALGKAASARLRGSDRTDIGLWFLHDSLEQSVEMMNQGGSRWVPSRILGKSPSTKMILNTHLDAIVALDRYRQVTGDTRYSEQVASALSATRRLLSLRPAEWLYRPVFWAIRLTLLPVGRAERLPLPLRALKRITRTHVIPQLHRIKRRFPRMVMPGGIIERHLAPLHFGVNYHSVNVADLARVWRRFPGEDFGAILDNAVSAVTQTTLPTYWLEAGQRQALGYWVEALYHLCTLRPTLAHRRYLAEAMLNALDAGLGLPPSLLGAHPEAVRPAQRVPCPSPVDARLRVANLSCNGHTEIVVVNPATDPIELAWEANADRDLAWTTGSGQPIAVSASPIAVPPRGWILGRDYPLG